MAFCRMGCDASDMYVWVDTEDTYHAWSGLGEYYTKDANKMLQFMVDNKEAGYTVPEYAIKNMKLECAESE